MDPRPVALPCLPALWGNKCPAGVLGSIVPLAPLLLLPDEPTSPKKPKSIAEPQARDMDSEATSPLSPGWTSVRFSPGEDTVGKDVLAVCVLVDCEDSRYGQAATGLHLGSGLLSICR